MFLLFHPKQLNIGNILCAISDGKLIQASTSGTVQWRRHSNISFEVKMIFHFFKINTDAFDVDMRPERKEKNTSRCKILMIPSYNDSVKSNNCISR